MRLFPLILWLSILSCAYPGFAQNHTTMPAPSAKSRKAYNERWIETGSLCINKLLARATLERKQIWTARFPDLKTLCREFERYWYFTNVYADAVGIPRQTPDTIWVQRAFEADSSKGQNPGMEFDLRLIQKFRKDIEEFAGSGSALLVDAAIQRFSHGEIYTLDRETEPTATAEGFLPASWHPIHTGDFWPPGKRFWGDAALPGKRE